MLANGYSGLDIIASKSALSFCKEWFHLPSISLNIVLPNKLQYNNNDIIRFTKSIPKYIHGDVYLKFSRNATKTKSNEYKREILWFPYETEFYNRKFDKLNISDNKLSSNKVHLLKMSSNDTFSRYYES